MTDIKVQLNDHQQRISEMEERVSGVEEAEARQHRVLRYLPQRDEQLTAVCGDLQNRLRRNNLCVFQIPEGTEQGDVVTFIKCLLPKVGCHPTWILKWRGLTARSSPDQQTRLLPPDQSS